MRTLDQALEELNIEFDSCLEELFRYIDLEKIDNDETLEDQLLEALEGIDDNGALHELVNSMIDIYTSYLLEWNVDNYDHVDKALEEGLVEESSGMIAMIQAGQYHKYNQDVWGLIFELEEKVKDHFLNVA